MAIDWSLSQNPARRTVLAGYLAVQAIAAAGFVIGGPPEDIRIWNGLFDVGHAMLFAMLMWTALQQASLFEPRGRARNALSLAALAIVLGLAGLSEVMQRFQPTRHPSFGDFLRDTAGAAAMYLFWRTSGQPRRKASAFLQRGIACTLILLVLGEFGMTLALYAERDRAVPVLLSFENRWWERRLISIRGGELSPLGSAAGAPACAPLTFRPGRVPALDFEEPYPDWTRFQQLAFSVMSNNEQPFRLRVRVNDDQYNGEDEDAFYRDYDLTKGEHRIEIPIEEIRQAPVYRALDMTRIRNITFFVWRPRQAINMCLSPLRLQ